MEVSPTLVGKPGTGSVVILFGAGASYGAGSTIPERPPLGSNLYSVLERNYPGSWGNLPNEIKDTFRMDFEAGMQLVYERFAPAIPSLMREMGVFFIQFRPYRRSTLYCHLIRDLAAANVLPHAIFSTLNYDCVLEFSLLEHGYDVNYFSDEGSRGIPVWKLHGSCNMFCHGVQAAPGVYYRTGITWEGGLQAFLDANRVIQHCLVETALAPAMCLYMRGKPLAISPSVIRGLQSRWAAAVDAASAVACVGVRPHPLDIHIWEPLARTVAPLYVVGNSEELAAWVSTNRHGLTEHIGNRFDEAYSVLVRRLSDYGT